MKSVIGNPPQRKNYQSSIIPPRRVFDIHHSVTPTLPHSHTPTLRHSFTLIELLVSMAILALLVVMISNMFQDTTMAWNVGTQKAEVNTAGRAAVELIARELSAAVAGPIDKSQSGGADYLPFRLVSSNDIRFLAIAQEPSVSGADTYRALRGVYFWSEQGELKYARRTESLDCYSSIWNQGLPPVLVQYTLITNVTDFQIYAYLNADGSYISSFPTTLTNNLPFCVDILVELMSANDMKKANALGAGKAAFIAKNAKCYSTRVYFPNRKGYDAR